MIEPDKVIIIGSGVAGLAAATRLAVQGFHVTVFEKNSYPGGKLSEIKSGDFHFDAGPSLFVQPQNIEELFVLAGENINEYFEYKPIPVACKYFYEDGTVINAYTSKEQFAQELEEKIGEPANNVLTYLSQSEKLYNNVANAFLNNSLHKRNFFFNPGIIKAIKSVRKKHLFNTLNSVNKTALSKTHSIQLFNRYATYSGSSPFKAPGMLCAIPHIEYNEGVFYPVGGMVSITNALYKLALKKGVQFYFDSPVQKIIEHENKVWGIVANNKNIYADVVVDNIDVYFTYKHLLNDERKAGNILKQERSSSALVFYWGIKKEFANLDLHNIFFSENYKEEFNHIFRLKKAYIDPTVYINITCKQEPGVHAPHNKENWFVMINVPANSGQNWDLIKKQARAIIIQKLNRILQIDVEPFIETEEILDPLLIENKTSSYMGSLYGTSSNSRVAAFLRHPNFSKKINGLYFVGGSVHPGGGIPLCLKSAKIMSELLKEDKGKWKRN